jgi:hypothetical protein
MKFFPVALVQKTVPEIRGIFVVRSNLKLKTRKRDEPVLRETEDRVRAGAIRPRATRSTYVPA